MLHWIILARTFVVPWTTFCGTEGWEKETTDTIGMGCSQSHQGRQFDGSTTVLRFKPCLSVNQPGDRRSGAI